jgi:hypothetical protein
VAAGLFVALAFTAAAPVAVAQNWSFDARAIGMGGTGSTGNLASTMIEKERPYTPIVLPFGLFQVLSDLDIYDPNSPKFDPIRAVEYAASPIHFVVGRDTSTSGEALFVSDIRNATFSRDLSKYRGFAPANDILAEGLSSPSWGGTIKVHRDADGGYQGIFIGAGPYLSQHVAATFDQQLTNVLASGVNAANATMPITNADQGQVAMAITGGYRGRFAWPGATSGTSSRSGREGVYVAANYNYLRGFLYENDALNITLATDRFGLLTPASTVFISHQRATSGTGFSLDTGAGVVYDRWDVGFGVNGISNRIDWTGVQQSTLRLASITSGGGFIQTATIAAPDARVELPLDYRGNVTYDAGTWSATSEAGHGFGGGSFHGGYERRFGRLEARGGARYAFGMWNPTGGIGVDLSRKVSVDVAAFGTTTNVEQKRQLALAASIRINHY